MIVPGLYLAYRYFFSAEKMMDDPKLRSSQALKKAGELTRKGGAKPILKVGLALFGAAILFGIVSEIVGFVESPDVTTNFGALQVLLQSVFDVMFGVFAIAFSTYLYVAYSKHASASN